MDLAAASVLLPKRPSPFFIDLNEIPPTPCDTPSPATAPAEPAPPEPSPPPPLECPSEEAYALVCRIHGRLAALDRPAAEFPGEAGVGRQLPCGLCGLLEKRRETMVCDGCDRGFHLSCARYWPRQSMTSEDWLCDECSMNEVQKKQKPWALWAVKLFDMNASPPSEGYAEEQSCVRSADGYYRFNEVTSSGILAKDSNSNIGYPVNAVTSGNSSGLVDTMANSVATVHGANSINGCDGLFLGNFVRSRYPVSRGAASSHSHKDIFLCSLRDFIAQKGGCLGEGWHVEFKQSANKSDSYAVYCSPDGRRFESVFDVARYLGVTSNPQPIENEKRGDASGLGQKSSPSRQRKRDFSKISASEISFKNLESITSNFDGEHSSDTENLEPQFSSVKSFSMVTNNVTEERCVSDTESLPACLPIQFEDFFISCFGKIDLRTAYHNSYQIWPVGYKSIWHDKITGSVFECEVFDGGDSGPVFRVKRVPCSLSPIPDAETSILCNTDTKAGVAVRMDENVVPGAECDRDVDILMLVCDPSPEDNNLSSLFSGDIGDSPYACSSPVDLLESGASTSSHDSCYVERCGTCSLVDDIGEFYVEGRSSAAVWKMVSETVLDICHEVFKKLGRVQFICRHDGMDFPSSYCKDFPYGSDNSSSKHVRSYGSLARFFCAFGPIIAPLVYNNNALEYSCKALSEWLEKDRFGLDVGFVQEMLETLPKSRACSSYQFLKDRSDSLLYWTIGSGQLVAVPKNAEKGEEVAIDSLQEGSKCSVLPEFEEPQACLRQLPHGQPLSNKLPWDIVGDVYQIWEFLCRFHEILGLRETLTFDELEEELVDPWPCVRGDLSSSEKHSQDSRDGNSQANGGTVGSLSAHESLEGFDRDNTSTFIPVENLLVREASQAKLAARTYERCTGLTLTKIHTSLLKLLIGELLNKVAVYVNPNFDVKESKPRRGRKKDLDSSHIKESKLETPNFNEFTWPELARRYVLSVLSMNGCMDSSEAHSREGAKVFRCLRGDGGILCGSFSGIAAMETDALLLAEAEKQIFDSVKHDDEVLQLDCKESEAEGGCETTVDTAGLPEWAQPLEPVRKLPTNVGTRIRRCIYNALEKDPPEWAKEILQHSISKEVYKGNASGPTKKAVLSVLSQATAGSVQKFYKRQKEKCPISVSDAIMRKCRIVLRSAVSADESKVFCNLIASSLLKSNDNEDEGILGLPAIVSRPLDFRTIDLRLAYGSYGGSHEAFLEDAREVWHNIHLAYRDRPDVSQLVGTLSQNFELLYEKEVLYLVQKFADRPFTEQDAETQNELRDILICSNELPKAPWEEGVCKVCGIDRDDDSVLLCDTCDSEYHTYCLNPPLARIPEGNWYCPSCISSRTNLQGVNPNAQVLCSKPRRHFGEETQAYQEALYQVVATLEENEYWELNIHKRVFLLKFLCDEVLNSVLMREHLDQCTDRSTDLHQKLRALTVEWRNLKFKEEMLALRTIKDPMKKTVGIDGTLKEDSITAMLAAHGRLMEQQQNFSNKMHYSSISALNDVPMQLESSLEESGQFDARMSQLLKSATVKHANGNLSRTCSPNSTSFADSVTAADVELATSKVAVTVSAKKDNQALEEIIPNSEHREHMPASVIQDNSDKRSISNVEKNESLLSNADTVIGNCLYPENGGTSFHNHSVMIPSSYGAKISTPNSLTFNQSATLQGNVMNINFSVVDFDNCDIELSSLKKEILQLQESIASLESQLMMASLRREFLGKDSFDQLYWIIGRPGRRSWLVVDRSFLIAQETRPVKEIRDREYKNSQDFGSSGPVFRREASSDLSICKGTIDYGLHVSTTGSSPIVQFESDSELDELVGWLRDNNPRERELKECILLWRRLRFSPENVCAPCESQLILNKSSIYEERIVPVSLNTKAANVLENKHGPFLEIEVNGIPKRRGKKVKISHDDRMYRCECLEPVWPSRQHCISCHQTFSTLVELEAHNDGKCTSNNPSSDEGKEIDDLLKTKGVKWEGAREKEHYDGLDTSESAKNRKWDISLNLVNFQKRCPYDLNEVSKRFITNNSNKELVKEIGLIGLHGVPSLIPGCFVHILEPTLMLDQIKLKNASMNEGYFNQIEAVSKDITQNDTGKVCKNISVLLQNGHADSHEESFLKNEGSASGHAEVRRTSSPAFKSESSKGSQNYTIPEPSLRPLLGKVSQIVKRLKINLLDMDAALPDEAIRPSKASLSRRCVWRMFVKSAESIYELVQATVLLEDMIKTDYLKNGWWYWSSLTAAAKTPTISALALRIYALDDSIIYMKDPPASLEPDSQQLITRVGRKRKDMDVGS